jgi:uncharacterized protein YcfJ
MKYYLSLPLLIAVAACAEQGAKYQPVLDGQPTPTYYADLQACQSLAANQSQFDRNTRTSAAIGAGLGAVLGEADEDDPLGGAIVGALAGAAAGSSEANDRREGIVVECLRGRGHKVVG